jgi:hypothetical protein
VSVALEAAFPRSLREAAQDAALVLPSPAHEPARPFTVNVQGEVLQIPERIYNPEPPSELVAGLAEAQAEVLGCLYTRHHDGFVRQRHLRRIIGLSHPWVAPFVVRLIGEYVVEILVEIREGLNELDVSGSRQRMQFGTFIAENPAFFNLTVDRVESYWNCYYRHRYPARSEYPGFLLLRSLRSAAAEPG